MSDTETKTRIIFMVEVADIEGSPEDFGLEEGVTAEGVIESLKEDGRGNLNDALAEWALREAIEVTVEVIEPDGKRNWATWRQEEDPSEDDTPQAEIDA